MKKKKRLSGIERRWFVNNVGVIMLLVAACVLGVVFSMAAYYDTNLRSGLENKAKTTTDFFSNYISQSYKEYYQSCIKFAQTFEEKDRLELQFISANGKLVASSYGKFAGRSPSTPEIQQAIDSQQIRHYKGRNPLTGERILAVSSPMIYTNGEVIGVLRYVTSLRNADLQILMIALIAVTIGLLFIGSIFFLSSFFIKSILVPVSQINATARRIAAGSYGVQIPGQYDDEIGELVSTINDMSVKIGQAEKTQTEFISSVSHELRTPLTAISGWGETLLTSENLDTETRRGVVIIAREAKRLTGMVEELLEFTRMQDGRFTLHVETADILAEFEDTVFMYGNRLKQEGICLHYDGCDEEIPEIPCDVARMRQVFLNILDNAAKHGGEGKRIDASIAHEGSFVVIRMRDYGPGIPEEELPKTLTSYSPCFRKEKGAHGLEERGVYRIHQFEKQEMIVVCKPEESKMWFDKLWQNTVDLFRSLDIPVRTLECCSGDLADLKVKSLDVEAWSPRQKKYFEVGSCSNLGDAQARRLKIRVNGKDGKKYLAHTLNNTVVAPPRMLIAFLENNLNADGSVNIPKALQPYMGGMTKIEKKTRA